MEMLEPSGPLAILLDLGDLVSRRRRVRLHAQSQSEALIAIVAADTFHLIPRGTTKYERPYTAFAAGSIGRARGTLRELAGSPSSPRKTPPLTSIFLLSVIPS